MIKRLIVPVALITITGCGGKTTTGDDTGSGDSGSETGEGMVESLHCKDSFETTSREFAEEYCSSIVECYGDDSYYGEYSSVDECIEYLNYNLTTYFDLSAEQCCDAVVDALQCYAQYFVCDDYSSYERCENQVEQTYQLGCYYYDDYYGYNYGDGDYGFAPYPLPDPGQGPDVDRPPGGGSAMGGGRGF